MHRQATYAGGHKSTNNILQFIVTQNMIFSLAEHNDFVIYDIQTGKVNQKLEFDKGFEVEKMMHPVTYVNKLLFIGGKKMQLWNVI